MRGRSTPAAVIIMIASTVVFLRVLIEVAVVAPSVLTSVAPPLGLMMIVMVLISLVAFRAARYGAGEAERQSPPSDLGAAVMFGALYGGVLVAIAFVQQAFGDPGMYVVAGLSGLTDMDAITLSTAHLMQSGTVDVATGWRLILVGAIANLFFKALVVAVLGRRELLARVAVLFSLSAAAGAALLAFWPA